MKTALTFCLLLLIALFYTDAQLSEEQKKIYRFHKRVREGALTCQIPGQPPAKKLERLKWSKKLARKAHEQAKRCDFYSDDPNDLIIGKFNSVGQNIAEFPSISGALKGWFKEHKNYDFEKNECRGDCKNYKQMVWNTTKAVGCGVHKCDKNYLVVCNYTPS
ncbi:unnamed protein product [Trichobilharzia regenti]|nr:unnamed protein product [Trichobilharzia regenti]